MPKAQLRREDEGAQPGRRAGRTDSEGHQHLIKRQNGERRTDRGEGEREESIRGKGENKGEGADVEAKSKRSCRKRWAWLTGSLAAQKACPGRQRSAEVSGIGSQPIRPQCTEEEMGDEDTEAERIHHSFKNHH